MTCKVSIIIPCYHSGNYITRCMDSIYKQDETNYEVIFVVDDYGHDDTVEKIKSHNLWKHRHGILCKKVDKSNPATARNTGLCYARGEYISFLDSDDEWEDEDFLSTSIDGLLSQYDMVYSNSLWVYPKRYFQVHGHDMSRIWLSNPVPFSTVVVRRDRCISFDTRLDASDDYKWLLDMNDAGRLIRYINMCKCNVYIHGSNLTAGNILALSKQAWNVHRLRGEYVLGIFKYLLNIPISLYQHWEIDG